ncbi:MAG: pyridoxine 5'-phosphate synthase [Candidatus Melainabacteria bacterium RIFCSPLOWO2_12_FULL_35_11]|nr:MAG: pyridoxine 5'-phosphate synthase [Candidatus Melainabacteria bacterium RIFCSPLOWO2_12_FULL_35_11]
MPKLCVNIDHIATVREARKTIEPDPILGAKLAIEGGADGITVHLREDRRHINDRDVLLLSQSIKDALFTLEMAATDEMLEISSKVKPELVTLVPEKRQELTTEGGLNVISQKIYLKNYLEKLHRNNLTVSIFINANNDQIKTAKEIGADFVEIHTGPYAENPNEKELNIIKEAVKYAKELGLKINAGHGLNYQNTAAIAEISGIEQLHIGHSIISRAVMVGIKEAVSEMKIIFSRFIPRYKGHLPWNNICTLN